MKTKTKKTPLMTAETFGLTYSSSRLVLKSKLLRSLEALYGFVPNPSCHGGKTPRFALKNRCALLNGVRHDSFCGFSFLLLKAAGCFHFVQLRRQDLRACSPEHR